jgi:hypothetical protein
MSVPLKRQREIEKNFAYVIVGDTEMFASNTEENDL